LGEMYSKVLSIGQVAPVPLTPLQPPYPYWYKSNLTREYHAGIVGHDIESYNAFHLRYNPYINNNQYFI
jgi:hypothetical protein